MKCLVAYYSKTGTTKKAAEKISEKLGCDIERIIDLKKRDGARGYVISGRDASMKKLTEIGDVKKDPAEYELVILGTPVWALNMTPAIRTYITMNRDKFKEIAFFCTQGGLGSKNVFKGMEMLTGKKPKGVLVLKAEQVNRGDIKVNNFVDKVLKKY